MQEVTTLESSFQEMGPESPFSTLAMLTQLGASLSCTTGKGECGGPQFFLISASLN